MAEISWVRSPGRANCYVWANMKKEDVGIPMSIFGAGTMTAQVFGNFESACSVVFEGSIELEDAEKHYFPLETCGGARLVFKMNGGYAIAIMVTSIRPRIVGGDGATLMTAILLVRSR